MRSALALLFLAAAAHANIELTLEVRNFVLPVKGVQQMGTKAPETQTIHLTLGSRWMQWEDWVYDFDKRAAFYTDSEANRLDERSLFAMLSGRLLELDNRLMLGGALRSARVADNPMAPTIAEHQLAVRHPKHEKSGIQRKDGKDEVRYLWQKKEIFAHSTEVLPLPAAARDLYLRFVRHTAGGHPEIFDDLQKLDGIPKWLRYSDPAFGNAKRIEVAATSETPDAPYTLPALEKATISNPAAAAAAAVVIASTPESRAAAGGRIIAAANAAADSGRPLEAMLGYLEHGLMFSGDLSVDFKSRQRSIVENADVKTLLGSLSAKTTPQARENVATLEGLEPAAGEKAYVAGIFRGNFAGNLGDGETAIALLTRALSKNPFLTGVWKDLGDGIDGYDATDTWRCYEMARRIDPKHSLVAAIDEREAKMLREHPEFF